MPTTDMPQDPFVSDAPGLVQPLREGWLLWDDLKSYDRVEAFFNALDALDAPDLRKVVMAARTEKVNTY